MTAPVQSPFPNGVYFGLDEGAYHADPALGSTDIRRILRSAPDYWWHSSLNPLKSEAEDESTPALTFGKAVHKAVLEGEEAFLALYAPCEFPGNVKAGKEERAAIEASGKTPLKRAEFDRILVAAGMIRANPHLADAFANGYPEVSVFWERDGVRCKCRFDYLKLRAVTDLKSIRNSREIEFKEACRRRLSDSRYDIQADHYLDGRRAMRSLVKEGKVFGEHDPDWLARAAAVDEFAFVFVFWQAEDAPISWGTSLSPGNPILEIGRASITEALSRYREFVKTFTADQAWILADPVEELDLNDLPNWFART